METIDSNKIVKAKNILSSMNCQNVKFAKKESGLMERDSNEDEKVILAEDNRQILFG